MVSLILLALSLSLTLAQLALPIRINCGGSAFTDADGNAWQTDDFFVAGSRVHVDPPANRISNVNNPTDQTTDETLYKTERFGPVTYNFQLDPGTYTVQFHLAEVWGPTQAVGRRVFAISIEGSEVFPSVDIFALGGANRAITLPLRTVDLQDNTLTITTRAIVENPKFNGIVIQRVASPPPPPPPGQRPVFSSTAPTRKALLNRCWAYRATVSNPNGVTFSLVSAPAQGTSTITTNGAFCLTPVSGQMSTTQSVTIRATNSAGTTDQTFTVRIDDSYYRINLGGPEFVDSDGNVWLADNNAGSVWADNNGVIFTDFNVGISRQNGFPLQVLQATRWDRPGGSPLNYRLPLPAGVRVDVDVIFAEIWTGANVANRRIFSVSVEGTTLANNLDMTATFGFRTMGVRTAANVAVPDNELNIAFAHGSQNNPSANAIRVRHRVTVSCNTNQTPCGSTCCDSTQICQIDSCVAPPTCNAPFVLQGGKCVFPLTAGLCPRNEVDCRLGCATLGTNANPATVCQGGVCENGVCVPVRPSTAQINALRTQIRNFVQAKLDDERINGAVDTGPKRQGDHVGAVVRLAFHDAGPARAARGCLFVRDQDSNSCGSQPCEFTADHNKGLETAVREIHSLYNSLNIWWQISLVDFIYLYESETVNLISDGRGVIRFLLGRQPCTCLLTRPFSACSAPPNFPASMPEPEMELADLKDIMENELGFTEQEWFALLGAHSLGRSMRNNTGYGRNWSPTPAKLDNRYFVTMNDDDWIRENGQISSNPDVPESAKVQFQLPTNALHSGQMMLKADMAPYWVIEGSNCDVTHGNTPNFCPPRNPQFDFLQQLQSNTFFFSRFNPAFVKLIELGATGLFTPS